MTFVPAVDHWARTPLPGCGHVPHQDQEARVLTLVTNFLENEVSR